jgi:hypothetical protein
MLGTRKRVFERRSMLWTHLLTRYRIGSACVAGHCSAKCPQISSRNQLSIRSATIVTNSAVGVTSQ